MAVDCENAREREIENARTRQQRRQSFRLFRLFFKLENLIEENCLVFYTTLNQAVLGTSGKEDTFSTTNTVSASKLILTRAHAKHVRIERESAREHFLVQRIIQRARIFSFTHKADCIERKEIRIFNLFLSAAAAHLRSASHHVRL